MVGLSAASSADAKVAPAATPACGFSCFNLSSLTLGLGTIQNAYVPGDTGVGGKVGQVVNLNYASNTHPNEDFQGAQVGTLSDYCGTTLSTTSYVCRTYPSGYPVFESNWAPFGNQTGLCSGVYNSASAPAYSGENVTLQPCGNNASTLWIGDLAKFVFRNGHVYLPWVNGASTSFSHSLVLTVDPGTVKPINQLRLQNLNTLSHGVVPDTQQFTFTFGPV
jgi:hypothetical protein